MVDSAVGGAIIAHEESKGIDNGVDEIPADNMSLHSKIKGKDIDEPKDEISSPSQFETDHEREPLPLPSLHKVANPYRLPIPPMCCPRESNNDKKPLKLKDPGSFMVNISIGGKKTVRAMLDLVGSINIMHYSVYL